MMTRFVETGVQSTPAEPMRARGWRGSIVPFPLDVSRAYGARGR
jgi:hypothetical protein